MSGKRVVVGRRIIWRGTGECVVDVEPAFVSDRESAEAVNPSEAALDDPSMAAGQRARGGRKDRSDDTSVPPKSSC
jgi:hypothetical protein